MKLREVNENIKDTGINSYLRDIRTIINFGTQREYIKPFKVQMIKAVEEVPITFSSFELEKILKKPNMNECKFEDYRNWVIAVYMLSTANRAKTVINLKIKDIDLESEDLLLGTLKNKKQQFIPVAKKLKKVIAEYLTYRKGEPNDYLFCQSNGEKLKYHGLKTAMNRYYKKCGVNKTGTHIFRKTFGKLWLENGGSITDLQKIFGHSTITMAEHYVDIFGIDRKEAFYEFNPIDNLDTFVPNEKIRIKKK